ncbi:hypothetical protein M422DRAFT_31764 [Sphaerobolus stellatus SS14]|uniref:SHSP domain-containing protein n=1 Tax=Sphaerobolus stellatus (strain SS14) TaxID=990650 RepID=A0A0C9VIS0_SPHS4|nr:hypothetical protein M422DRAFT_31764 [Sphaerobolus stellatus SS14]
MSITSFYEPFFNTLADFDRLFDAAWDKRSQNNNNGNSDSTVSPQGSNSFFKPRMDLHEDKEKNLVTAAFEFPGLKKEDINIDVHNNRLVVSGQSSQASELDKDGYAVRERRFGRFSRTLPLPTGTKPEEIKASMSDGILTVTFPRSQPDKEPKKITIS